MSDKQAMALHRRLIREIERKESEITREIDVVEHAKIVRSELKKKFTDIAFRVNSARFSGGTSVMVHHVGELSRQVEQEIMDFVKRFDGYDSGLMDDSYNVGFVYNGERIRGAKFCSYNYRWHKG